MIKLNPKNERIKRKYLRFQQEARGQSTATLDTIAAALDSFESYNKRKDFERFHYEQATGFKKHLLKQKSQSTGKPLAKSTLKRTLNSLRQFIEWLSQQQGYKSRIAYCDGAYFSLSEKDNRIAGTKKPPRFPSIEIIQNTVEVMPNDSDIDRRNRALMAFTILTGARDSAIASLKLKHVYLKERRIYQDANEVNTKFGKSINTFFFPVGWQFEEIVSRWVNYLSEELKWSPDDPLFPKTKTHSPESSTFGPKGIERQHWTTTSPIRSIFKEAFRAAGYEYYNPHSFRKTLGQLGEKICASPEEFKAWSQVLGHSDVLTTFQNYGEVQDHRLKELFSEGKLSGDINQTYSDEEFEEAVRKVLSRVNSG